MDSAIMDGATGNAGAAKFKRLKNPIEVARAVLDKSVHVFLSGTGAEEFAYRARTNTSRTILFFCSKELR